MVAVAVAPKGATVAVTAVAAILTGGLGVMQAHVMCVQKAMARLHWLGLRLLRRRRYVLRRVQRHHLIETPQEEVYPVLMCASAGIAATGAAIGAAIGAAAGAATGAATA